GLSDAVRDTFGIEFGVEPGTPRDRLEEQLFTAIEKRWNQKEQELGKDEHGVEVLRRFEQWFALQSIDQHWKDHLLQMDHLRQGIGLRGYGQKDPKVEYKKEGFSLFQQMVYRMKEQVGSQVLRFQVQTPEQQQAEQRRSESATKAAQDLEKRIADQRRRQRV